MLYTLLDQQQWKKKHKICFLILPCCVLCCLVVSHHFYSNNSLHSHNILAACTRHDYSFQFYCFFYFFFAAALVPFLSSSPFLTHVLESYNTFWLLARHKCLHFIQTHTTFYSYHTILNIYVYLYGCYLKI